MSETVALNDFSTLNYKEMRTRKKFLVTIKADPLIHNFDPVALGKGPAEAIAAHLRAQIQGITAPASPATVRAREVAATAFTRGKQWALRRYSGGKTGPMAPAMTTRLFNDSGRFAEKLIASPRQKDGEGVYIVNVAANRLDGRTLDNGGDAVVPVLFRKLSSLVPAFASPEAMLSAPEVRKAIDESMRLLILRTNDVGNRKAWQLARQALGLLRTVWQFG